MLTSILCTHDAQVMPEMDRVTVSSVSRCCSVAPKPRLCVIRQIQDDNNNNNQNYYYNGNNNNNNKTQT